MLTLTLVACQLPEPFPPTLPVERTGSILATASPNATPTPSATAQPQSTVPNLGQNSGPAAQPVSHTRLSEIDYHALNTPASVEGSAKDLAAYLTAPAMDDFEKSRAIFTWITAKISYDSKVFFSKRYGDQSAGNALKTRMAVCEGYANLFQSLGRAAGLEVVVIGGWAKGYGYDIDELNGDPNHAWNAVKLNDAWYLLDSTWGAGHLNVEKQFERKFSPYYWLTPPNQMIVDHLPEESRWQLLPASVTKTRFAAAPWVGPAFHGYGMHLPSEVTALTRVTGQASLTVSAPPEVLITAAIERDGKRLDNMWTFAQRNGSQYEIEAVFPSPGKYDLLIFAKRENDGSNFYEGVASLGYDATQGQSSFPGFATASGKFSQSGGYLYCPKYKGLAPGEVKAFKLNVVGARAVSVISGDVWTDLVRQGDTYQGTVTVTRTPVQVCARFDSSQRYDCLLEY